ALTHVMNLPVSQHNRAHENLRVRHDSGIGQYLFSRHDPAPWGSYRDNGRKWRRVWRHHEKWRSAPHPPPWLRHTAQSPPLGWFRPVTRWVRPATAPASAP